MKTKYDWSNVPKEVNWIATDSDGVAHGFKAKPKIKEGLVYDMWACNDNFVEYIELADNQHRRFGKSNWQDSLEERPK